MKVQEPFRIEVHPVEEIGWEFEWRMKILSIVIAVFFLGGGLFFLIW